LVCIGIALKYRDGIPFEAQPFGESQPAPTICLRDLEDASVTSKNQGIHSPTILLLDGIGWNLDFNEKSSLHVFITYILEQYLMSTNDYPTPTFNCQLEAVQGEAPPGSKLLCSLMNTMVIKCYNPLKS
jgi:hypothetical protein